MSSQISRFVIPINTAFSIPFNWYDTAGTLDADVDVVTATAVDAMGDAVTLGSVADGADGTYTVALPAQSQPNLITVTLVDSDVTTETRIITVEVTGNTLFDEADARGRAIKGVNPLADTAAYSDDLIRAGRAQVSDMFEERTGRSFVRRYCRAEFAGNGGAFLLASQGRRRTAAGAGVGGVGYGRDVIKVLSATVNGVAVSTDDITVDTYGFYRTSGSWSAAKATDPRNVVIEYEYGLDPVPFTAQEEGLKLLFVNVVPSDVASRATSMSNEDGTFRLTTFPRTVEEFIMANDVRSIL